MSLNDLRARRATQRSLRAASGPVGPAPMGGAPGGDAEELVDAQETWGVTVAAQDGLAAPLEVEMAYSPAADATGLSSPQDTPVELLWRMVTRRVVVTAPAEAGVLTFAEWLRGEASESAEAELTIGPEDDAATFTAVYEAAE